MSALAASIRNRGLDVRAGAPRRSQASSLRARFCRFASVVAPGVPVPFREVLLAAEVGLGYGSCAASVYLSRPVLVADMSKDPYWNRNRAAALKSGLAAA